MGQGNAITFLSGRMIALVVLLAFQMSVVRLLPPAEYGLFAVTLALATLFQTVISFGVPRLIPRYISEAGTGLAPRTVTYLAIAIILFRVGASGLLLTVLALVAPHIGLGAQLSPALMAICATYILISIVQVDSDAMTQALSLQHLSRACLVAEAVVRLGILWIAAWAGYGRSAEDVVALCALTAGVASFATLAFIFVALARMPDGSEGRALDRRTFRALALGGWASAIAWFASSPAMIRLLAGRMLDVVNFAGFSFVQALVLSFQRYTPGMLLFPFVEANVMRHYARTGDRSRLENALSLVIKIDMLVIGGAIVGTAVAGGAIVGIMAGGRYEAMGIALPWLLAYILSTSIYRAFEIVAVALGATSVLVRMLAISGLWLAVMLFLGRDYGVMALLVCPIGDALTRLGLMTLSLRRLGIAHVIDLPFLGQLSALVLGLAGAGWWIVASLGLGPWVALAIGTGTGLIYLLAVVLLRPFRANEMDLLAEGRRLPGAFLLRRVTRAN